MSSLNLTTIDNIINVLPELRNILSKKDMKALENILPDFISQLEMGGTKCE